MAHTELSIFGITGEVLTGDQLTDAQRETYSEQASASLTASPHTKDVGADVLAAHMEADLSVVIVEPSKDSLLAHAYLRPKQEGVAELGGVYRWAKGFGEPVIEETAAHAMRQGMDSVYAVVRANNPGGIRIFSKICGVTPETQISEKTGRKIKIFDLTQVGKKKA